MTVLITLVQSGNAPLPAAAVADALVRLGKPVRLAPAELRRAAPGAPISGPAVAVHHHGSVDVFLEALETAAPGSVLVIDNEARLDEACIGDLIVGETRLAGLAGIVVWGLHRDAAQIREIGLPVWSLGTVPAGPRGARPATPAGTPVRVGEVVVSAADVVVADDDGVLFVASADWPEVARIAAKIVEVEGAQARGIAAGLALRDQLRFRDYLLRREADPTYTLREHLRALGAAIET
jgi:regulator of RNase E activity RraA